MMIRRTIALVYERQSIDRKFSLKSFIFSKRKSYICTNGETRIQSKTHFLLHYLHVDSTQ